MFLNISLFSQSKKAFSLKEGQYYLGGDASLSFGSAQSFYQIAPELSFEYYKNIHLGVGFFYSSYSDRSTSTTYTESNYGIRLFTRAFPFEKVYFHGEYERSFIKSPYLFNPNGTNTLGLDAVNVGIGFIQGDRESSYSYIAILYNALNQEFFIGYNPFLRAGFVWAL
jgi:hypothetical protein